MSVSRLSLLVMVVVILLISVISVVLANSPKAYLDIITGRSVATDYNPSEIIDDVFIRFQGKLISNSELTDVFGNQPSAEAEKFNESAEEVVDIVSHHHLTKIPMDKNALKNTVILYIQRLFNSLDDSRVTFLKKNFQRSFYTNILASFEEFTFYQTEYGSEGNIGFLKYIDGIPYIYYIKDGLEKKELGF